MPQCTIDLIVEHPLTGSPNWGPPFGRPKISGKVLKKIHTVGCRKCGPVSVASNLQRLRFRVVKKGLISVTSPDV